MPIARGTAFLIRFTRVASPARCRGPVAVWPTLRHQRFMEKFDLKTLFLRRQDYTGVFKRHLALRHSFLMSRDAAHARYKRFAGVLRTPARGQPPRGAAQSSSITGNKIHIDSARAWPRPNTRNEILCCLSRPENIAFLAALSNKQQILKISSWHRPKRFCSDWFSLWRFRERLPPVPGIPTSTGCSLVWDNAAHGGHPCPHPIPGDMGMPPPGCSHQSGGGKAGRSPVCGTG